jgi:hypothetical protein
MPMSAGLVSGVLSAFHHRREKDRVFVVALDGFESSLVVSHKNSRIPRGCLENVSHQIINTAHAKRILLWGSQPTKHLHLERLTRPFHGQADRMQIRVWVANVLEFVLPIDCFVMAL